MDVAKASTPEALVARTRELAGKAPATPKEAVHALCPNPACGTHFYMLHLEWVKEREALTEQLRQGALALAAALELARKERESLEGRNEIHCREKREMEHALGGCEGEGGYPTGNVDFGGNEEYRSCSCIACAPLKTVRESVPDATSVQDAWTKLLARNARLEAVAKAVTSAARNFYAMVEGESPSLIEDDHNATALTDAIELLDAALTGQGGTDV